MIDLISRQALCEYALNQKDKSVTPNDIMRFPSAQPYTEADIQKMQDLEQAELDKAFECGRASAQPEIIRCKDCKQFRRWIDTKIVFCDRTELEVSSDDFCSRAERREDG